MIGYPFLLRSNHYSNQFLTRMIRMIRIRVEDD